MGAGGQYETNIKAAFRKTGVIPLDRSVVTPEMMAPAETTSIRTTGPVQQSTIVQSITEMMWDYIDHQAALQGPSSTPLYIRHSVQSLQSTPARYLVTKSPMKSSSNPPTVPTNQISPRKSDSRYQALINMPANTPHEKALRDALIESEARDSARKEALVVAQAGHVILGRR